MRKKSLPKRLEHSSLRVRETKRLSRKNRGSGLQPAFCDRDTGAVNISCFLDGRPAPVHVLEGLPPEWIQQRDAAGHVIKLKTTVVAGFVYHGIFYTREEAACFRQPSPQPKNGSGLP